MKKVFLIGSILLTTFFTSRSQNIKTSEGFYEMPIPANYSIAEAKKKCVENAKVEAIEKAFGSTVLNETSQVDTEVETNGAIDHSETIFNVVGNSLVRGDWVKDLIKPEVKVFTKGDEIWVSAKVKGRIRKIEATKVQFQAEPLRCPKLQCRAKIFNNKEQLYTQFSAPTDGYLAIYLQEEDTVYCLLPYPKDSTGIFEVKANKNYMLFSREHAECEQESVKEYMLFTDRKKLALQLHIIFSTKPFIKCTDKQEQYAIHNNYAPPRQLWYHNFEEWLSNNRVYDNNMQRKTIPIYVTQ